MIVVQGLRLLVHVFNVLFVVRTSICLSVLLGAAGRWIDIYIYNYICIYIHKRKYRNVFGDRLIFQRHHLSDIR